MLNWLQEQTVGLLQTNTSSPDYKTAPKLLSDLTAKVKCQPKTPQNR